VLLVMVTTAGVHDSVIAKELLFRLALTHPEAAIVWADSAYAGKLVAWAKKYLDITIKTVERSITWAAITLMTRRLARKGATPSWPRKPAPVDG
jgi:hypothetical protein